MMGLHELVKIGVSAQGSSGKKEVLLCSSICFTESSPFCKYLGLPDCSMLIWGLSCASSLRTVSGFRQWQLRSAICVHLQGDDNPSIHIAAFIDL